MNLDKNAFFNYFCGFLNQPEIGVFLLHIRALFIDLFIQRNLLTTFGVRPWSVYLVVLVCGRQFWVTSFRFVWDFIRFLFMANDVQILNVVSRKALVLSYLCSIVNNIFETLSFPHPITAASNSVGNWAAETKPSFACFLIVPPYRRRIFPT